MRGLVIVTISLYAVLECFSFKNYVERFYVKKINKENERYSTKLNSYYNDNNEYLDSENLKRLEKMFYMKNRRYSPYNKNNYMNNTINNNREVIKINKEMINNINDEIMENFKKMFDEISNTTEKDDFTDIDTDDTEEIYGSKKRNDDGYLDSLGVYRYRYPTKIFIPTMNKNTKNTNNVNSGGSQQSNEFDTGSQFQIIKDSEYTFMDIGGYEKVKTELMQTADILVNYEKYKKFNVRTPKGMIFEGPPGNGKTLMAKCFSGEINVTFIPVSGSEFSEKYVGVGASRVRELFKLANENKPCIIFIDEIDALARKRGNDMVTSNSEKDQTLNQLLISLDGFREANGVFVIGATNRLDLLDSALTRAGRMDKNIFIGNPDSDTRKSIINIHLKGKPHDNRITDEYIVEMTGGFSGAQIENLLNEAMLKALRDNREHITVDDLEFITNRILSGWQSTENKFSDDIIDRIASHEMGHAIVGYYSEDHPKLVKICLNTWSPKTPGYTVFNNTDENVNIYTKNGLFSHLMVLLSGRIAEEVFYGYSVTTGARKDFEEAYNLAKSMILNYGMGKQNIYPDSSDKSKFLIDQEINELILKAQEEALKIITNSKDLILYCKEILKTTKIIKIEDIDRILELERPQVLSTPTPLIFKDR